MLISLTCINNGRTPLRNALLLTTVESIMNHVSKWHSNEYKISGFKTKLSCHPTFQNSSEATVKLHFKRLQRWSKLRLSIAGLLAGLLEPLQTCFIQSLLLMISLLPFIEPSLAFISALTYTGRLKN